MAVAALEFTCAGCGSPDVTILAHAASHPLGAELRTVWKCELCRREWVVAATMTAVRDGAARVMSPKPKQGEPARCGTERGYRAHRPGPVECGWCKAAHRWYNHRVERNIPASTDYQVPKPEAVAS